MTDLGLIPAAVVGCGRMGAFTSESVKRFAPSCWFPLSHIEAMTAHSMVDVRAACDNTHANLTRALAAYKIPRGFADAFTMLDAEQPMMLGVATRTPGRAAIINYAYERGTRAFHVEKPLCNSMAELATLHALRDDDRCFMTYGTIRRLFRVYEVARELATSGEFGDLQEVRVQLGRGQLFWTHPHSVDLVLFAAAGRAIGQVHGRLSNVLMSDDHTIQSDPFIELATIEFEDGVIAHIGRGAGAEMLFICSAGEIRVVSDGRSIELRKTYGSDPYLVRTDYTGRIEAPRREGVFAAISQLAACLGHSAVAIEANRVIKQDIFTGQHILFAIAQSQLMGSRPVTLANVDPDLVIEGKSGQAYA